MSEWNGSGQLSIEGWEWCFDEHETDTPPILRCSHTVIRGGIVYYPRVVSVFSDNKSTNICLDCIQERLNGISPKDGYPKCFGCGKYYEDCDNFCECDRAFKMPEDGAFRHF